jgi:hypothetical protein
MRSEAEVLQYWLQWLPTAAPSDLPRPIFGRYHQSLTEAGLSETEADGRITAILRLMRTETDGLAGILQQHLYEPPPRLQYESKHESKRATCVDGGRARVRPRPGCLYGARPQCRVSGNRGMRCDGGRLPLRMGGHPLTSIRQISGAPSLAFASCTMRIRPRCRVGRRQKRDLPGLSLKSSVTRPVLRNHFRPTFET